MWEQLKFQQQQGGNKLAEEYAALPKCMLRVTAVMGHAYQPCVDGAIHLDALLARAVAARGTWDRDRGLLPLPLPLEVLWATPDGRPLWASSNLVPDEVTFPAVEYWHKKFALGPMLKWANKPNTPTTRGPFKEYRIPMRLAIAPTLSAHCIGHKETLQELLSDIPSIGKKSAQGKGAVVSWRVQESKATRDDLWNNRPIPVAAWPNVKGKKSLPIGGWTPPYWYAPWHDEIWL